MAEIRNLTRNGETFYPLTHVDAIVSNTGSGIDDVPTAGSDNPVKSGGILLSQATAHLGSEILIGKKLDQQGNLVDDPTYFVTPFFEVTPTTGHYYINWTWGTVNNVDRVTILAVYDDSKNSIGFFGSIAGDTYRQVRISLYTGYKYYRVSSKIDDYGKIILYDMITKRYSFSGMGVNNITNLIYSIDDDKDTAPVKNSVKAVTSDGILTSTVPQIFASNNDGRLIEMYFPNADPNYKYYFKYFRLYNNVYGFQIRLFRYTQSDKSDEEQIANENYYQYNNIIKLNNNFSFDIYIVVNFKETDTDNLQLELNTNSISSLTLCPHISSYLNNLHYFQFIYGESVTLGRGITRGTGEEFIDYNMIITPYIEVEQVSGDYVLDWTWGIHPGVVNYSYLAIYDENKNFIGGFSELSGQTSRYTRISAVQGYKYYRLSIPLRYYMNISLFDRITQKYSVIYKTIPEILGNDDIIDNDIVSMPSSTYLLRGTENSMYHLNYLKYINDRFFVAPRNTFISNGWKFLDRCVRVTTSTSNHIDINLVRKDNLGVLKLFRINGVFGDPSISTPKNVNCIGDSFTYNGTWYQEISDLTEGLTFVGMRKSYSTQEPLRAEGRGGWKLSSYFSPYGDVTPTHMQPFSPFMHVTGYTYYGVIDFWKVIVNNNSQYTYGTNGFDDYKSWFNTNGYKVNPSANDLMYDGVNNKYVYYNGSSWVDYNGVPEFVFDYSKYITTWNISSPDIVIIMLGKNDFQNDASESVFDDWAAKMDIVIESIRNYAAASSKTIKIGLCTPTVANDSPNNSDNNSPYIGGRNMWLARKMMIDYFDNDTYKNKNVFIVDCGICLDPLYGFSMTEMKPFEFYTGTERELISTNGVHPSGAGYKQIGVCVAGFIQAIR